MLLPQPKHSHAQLSETHADGEHYVPTRSSRLLGSKNPKEETEIKDTGEAREVLWHWLSLVLASSFFGVTEYLQSQTGKTSWGMAAPRFWRMLCGILVHLGQRWGGEGSARRDGWDAARLDISPASRLLRFWGGFFLPPPAPKQRFKLNLYLSWQIEVLTKEKIGFSQNVFPSDSSQILKSCFSLGKLTSNSFLILPTTVTVRKAFLVDYIIIFFLTRSTLH